MSRPVPRPKHHPTERLLWVKPLRHEADHSAAVSVKYKNVYNHSCIHPARLHGEGKGTFYPRTGHEGPEGSKGIAILFLQPQR